MKSSLQNSLLALSTFAILAAGQTVQAGFGGHFGHSAQRRMTASPTNSSKVSPAVKAATATKLPTAVKTANPSSFIASNFNSTTLKAIPRKPIVTKAGGATTGNTTTGTGTKGTTTNTGTGSTSSSSSSSATANSNGGFGSGIGSTVLSMLSSLASSGSGGGSSGGGSSDDSSSAADTSTQTADTTPAATPVAATTPAAAPASASAAADLQPVDIKLVDAGVPNENLGPRYRVTVFNGGAANVNQEFTVRLMASADGQPGADLPGAVKRVSGLNAGDATTVDLRLPQGLSFQYLVVVVDNEGEVTDANRGNNAAVMATDAPAVAGR